MLAKMASIRTKSFDEPDEVRRFPFMDSQLAQIGSIGVGRALLQPGWRWSTSIGPVTGDALCQVHHISLVLAGRIAFQTEDGDVAEIGPDTLVDVPPGHDAWVVGDERVVLIDLYGNAGDVGLPTTRQRVVTTILMSDIVESTATAARLGDARWRQLLSEHDRLVRTQLDRFGGQEINTTGDGFIATFQSAVSALRCAAAIRDGVNALDLAVRVGVHTGEVEVVANDIRGVTVHAAARIMALAAPSEVLASELTRNLVDGSGLSFEQRGAHAVKGFDHPVTVYALAT
jgi:class 3 adenylate cyclase